MLSRVLRTVMLLVTVFVTEVLVSLTASFSGKVPSGRVAFSGLLQGWSAYVVTGVVEMVHVHCNRSLDPPLTVDALASRTTRNRPSDDSGP